MTVSKSVEKGTLADIESTVFVQLTAAQDKAAMLAEVLSDLRGGNPQEGSVYAVSTQFLRQVPGTPFAYWATNALRQAFQLFPPFETDQRTVRQGLATADDFRFIRAWWEAPPGRVCPPQRHPTYPDGPYCVVGLYRWFPLAKGGEFSPYFADLHLVVNWERDGDEIRNFANPETGRTYSRPQSTFFFFRPGLTWPRRTNGLSFRRLPAGSVFGDKGPAAFVQGDDRYQLSVLASLLNSAMVYAFVQALVARVTLAITFEVGLIQTVPIPQVGDKTESLLAQLSNESGTSLQHLAASHEITHAFCRPALAHGGGDGLAVKSAIWSENVVTVQQTLTENQSRVNDLVYALYEISDEDRRAIESSLHKNSGGDSESAEEVATDDEIQTSGVVVEAPSLVSELVSYIVGCAFGRWDVRLSLGIRPTPTLPDLFDPLPVSSPGMLVGDDGLPAREVPPGYPLPIPWDGILVDDDDHLEDVIRRVRDVLALLWPSGDGAESGGIEREACNMLGVRDLQEYFRRPINFFANHLTRYSKSRRQAPIYWPLSTASGSYTLWIYYHRLTADTLYTAANRFVEPKLAEVGRTLSELETNLAAASGREATRLRAEADAARALLDELRDFRTELLRVAALPYKPDLNDGVIINAAPLHKLFRLPKWAKDTRECWEKLQRGDYDWAHLAYTIWPERVREKCRTDRSLAIAHDLESLYEKPVGTATRRGGMAVEADGEADEDE